jgi:predicted RNA methylase
MQAYYDSVFENKAQFEDAVVLDVGTGSGILAIWAAQAGARKVYAVEVSHDASGACLSGLPGSGAANQCCWIRWAHACCSRVAAACALACALW